MKIEKITQSKKEKVIKLKISLKDKYCIESVVFDSSRYITAIISSQVGCPISCIYCNSGTYFFRNLTKKEIIKQIELSQKIAKKLFYKNIEYVKFSGIGEPLLNLNNVLGAIKIIKNKYPKIKINISTIGISEGLKKLNLSKLDFDIVISLNSTSNKERKLLMPGIKKEKLTEIIKNINQIQNKKIQIYYLLINNINDDIKDIYRLKKFFNKNHGITLKKLCPNNNLNIKSSKKSTFELFQKQIAKKYLECKISYSKGRTIKAACGQLITY
jgi:23S rRNA (adenine2503-C2)-methyltransferase